MTKKIYVLEKSKDKNKGRNKDEFLPIWSWRQIKCKKWLEEIPGDRGGMKKRRILKNKKRINKNKKKSIFNVDFFI